MDDFISFLERSSTIWHASAEVCSRLHKAGFEQLDEREVWRLEKGRSYFVAREGAAVLAFRVPHEGIERALVLATHIDSPALRLKPHPDVEADKMWVLGTELYGGPLMATWLDRDLHIAGRVIRRDGKQELLQFEERITIPNVAIHLNKAVNDDGLKLHKQDHMRPIAKIGNRLGSYLSFDLLLVPAEKPAKLAEDRIAAYRLDNLITAYPCLQALIEAKPAKGLLPMAAFWDHEEVGSETSTGADSAFLLETLERIVGSREALFPLKARSTVLSCDVTHAYHPNYADKYDAENAPRMGAGVAVKFSGQMKYATSALSLAPLAKLADQVKILLQVGANRSDIPGGSTVGPIMAAGLGMKTVDLGVGLWAMHSIRETGSLADMRALGQLLKAAVTEGL